MRNFKGKPTVPQVNNSIDVTRHEKICNVCGRVTAQSHLYRMADFGWGMEYGCCDCLGISESERFDIAQSECLDAVESERFDIAESARTNISVTRNEKKKAEQWPAYYVRWSLKQALSIVVGGDLVNSHSQSLDYGPQNLRGSVCEARVAIAVAQGLESLQSLQKVLDARAADVVANGGSHAQHEKVSLLLGQLDTVITHFDVFLGGGE